MEQIIKIVVFILNSFLHIWPYLLITIPLAVLVQQSGVSKLLNRALSHNPLLSIFLATVIGALSPFCSCGVIPVIASLLISGVPIAPVMSFWIASPSMDPEIFFLSTTAIGWELSAWRLAATFGISLAAGYITYLLSIYGFLGKNILRQRNLKVQLSAIHHSNKNTMVIDCCISDESYGFASHRHYGHNNKKNSLNKNTILNMSAFILWWQTTDRKKLLKETLQASAMVVKFMGIAFFINALITFFIEKEFLFDMLSTRGILSILTAVLAGIPAYTTNITALPLIGGLLSAGMDPGAALAFLIAGPVTTLPAMVAVWGIASRRVFLLYLSFSLIGALLAGLLYNLINY